MQSIQGWLWHHASCSVAPCFTLLPKVRNQSLKILPQRLIMLITPPRLPASYQLQWMADNELSGIMTCVQTVLLTLCIFAAACVQYG